MSLAQAASESGWGTSRFAAQGNSLFGQWTWGKGLIRQSLRISGTVLADTLMNYSERGQAYVDDLKGLIRQNRLDDADDAYLRQMTVIHIVPAGAETK